jgi:hypothetical protein
MGAAVYLLCTVTSLACAVLLGRGYRRSRARLLLWSALCFLGLTVENMALFVDMVILPEYDLALWRNLVALAAVSTLLFGLIWELEGGRP